MSEKDFTHEEAIAKIRGTIGDRAKLMATTLKHMKQSGVENAEEVVGGAAYELGQLDGKSLEGVETAGELARRLFTSLTQDTFEAEIVEDGDERAEVHIHHCPLVVGWRDAGLAPDEVNDICNLANIRDDGLASELPLDMGFTTRIAAGDGFCTFVITKEE